ncbi:RluA family pseudouridine synthase [Gracilibacillus marinus]|jgi:23S rRNA pseudouridine1911/1915/1917 synthase|uniref:Pseudouridine synthase n=1 Tax=Gracilibacillus marinus TaxID=630535 RepID=A0ABV8VYQ8_9BACI
MEKTQRSMIDTVKTNELLLEYLLKTLENKSRNAIKSILTRGQVYVNGIQVTKHNYELKIGDKIEITTNKVAKAAVFQNMSILYEDDSIIVINKGAGLLSMASGKDNELTAYKQLTTYVKKLHPKNRVFIVHRLDQETSGVMVLAKTEKAKQYLQNNWKHIVEERTYIALVEGKVAKEDGTIKSWLKETKTYKMYSSDTPQDGKLAITHYHVKKRSNHNTLLTVKLDTGRKNQIRVHMHDLGNPIVGDKKYGAKTNPIKRLGLHAQILAFKHPDTKKIVRFEANFPKSFLNQMKKNL